MNHQEQAELQEPDPTRYHVLVPFIIIRTRLIEKNSQ